MKIDGIKVDLSKPRYEEPSPLRSRVQGVIDELSPKRGKGVAELVLEAGVRANNLMELGLAPKMDLDISRVASAEVKSNGGVKSFLSLVNKSGVDSSKDVMMR